MEDNKGGTPASKLREIFEAARTDDTPPCAYWMGSPDAKARLENRGYVFELADFDVAHEEFELARTEGATPYCFFLRTLTLITYAEFVREVVRQTGPDVDDIVGFGEGDDWTLYRVAVVPPQRAWWSYGSGNITALEGIGYRFEQTNDPHVIERYRHVNAQWGMRVMSDAIDGMFNITPGSERYRRKSEWPEIDDIVYCGGGRSTPVLMVITATPSRPPREQRKQKPRTWGVWAHELNSLLAGRTYADATEDLPQIIEALKPVGFAVTTTDGRIARMLRERGIPHNNNTAEEYEIRKGDALLVFHSDRRMTAVTVTSYKDRHR